MCCRLYFKGLLDLITLNYLQNVKAFIELEQNCDILNTEKEIKLHIIQEN